MMNSNNFFKSIFVSNIYVDGNQIFLTPLLVSPPNGRGHLLSLILGLKFRINDFGKSKELQCEFFCKNAFLGHILV